MRPGLAFTWATGTGGALGPGEVLDQQSSVLEEGVSLANSGRLTYTRIMTRAEVEKLLELPAEDRAEVVSILWESLEQEPLPLTAEEKALLDERLAEAEQNPNSGIPWEQVRAELWPDE